MIKLKDLLNENLDEIKNGRIGDYFMQKAGSDTINYGVIVDELTNGAFKVVMFPVRKGKMTSKAKTASTKGWYPEPKKISKDEIPSKVLSKIEKKSKKYESVKEGRWSRGVMNPAEAEKYGDVLHGDHFDGWRKKMKDMLDTKKNKLSRSAYQIWIDKIKNAKSSKATAEVTKGIKNIVEAVNEATHKTYFNSFSGAASEAAKVAEKEGYQIDEDDWFKQVGTGGRYTRSRPSEGDTHRFTVGLLKRGKPAKKALHFQVYGMGNKYELNAYVN